MKTNNQFKKYYIYLKENGKKVIIATYTMLKDVTKEDIKNILKEENIKYDGIDSVYPAI